MMTTRRLIGLALIGTVVLFGSSEAWAADTQVAVAANFTEPAKAIAQAFKAATGHTASLSFGSSGQFYAQMSHGAPFEVFLSADTERPAAAEREGLGVAGTRFTYAVGKLVLYSKTPGLVDSAGAVLKGGKFAKLAIADPATAPYGTAAVQTLTKLGLYEALKPKIVQGSSIAQAYQFTETGAAELGFVALSQVVNVRGGSHWIVPDADHAPIAQQAILMQPGRDSVAAKAFLAFLKGPQAVAIIKKYGYDVR
ncbi:molybdate ABC transporter substrate-binding protein [Phenylobacterium sp.]|jgi:molybdate transport system substrate-binding protein|uniref:molybdate ABC transporter substrate-binding protein n=1 Tax=Phenylobacterium sp. TaxID=1871053 RepID=UPI002F42F38D